MLKIIYSMFDSAKSWARPYHSIAKSFYGNVGVRQGGNLSQILFKLFLNDSVDFLSNGFHGLSDITDAIHWLCDNYSMIAISSVICR